MKVDLERVRAAEEKVRSLDIIREALETLHAKLPKTLRYHTAHHTEEVLHDALTYAVTDDLPDRSVELLAIAAVFHDMGFIERKSKNEALGATMAGKAMKDSGKYSDIEIATVKRMIADTEMKEVEGGTAQVPTHELSKYLLDADLTNLGREDFLNTTELIREEWNIAKNREFYRGVKKMMGLHAWHTKAAKALREKQKGQNLAALEALVATMRSA